MYEQSNDELMHYGVLGMKWGVTKSQKFADKSQMRKSIKQDNKKAFQIGKSATIYGKAMNYGAKKTINIEKKLDKAYAKDPKGSKKKTKKLYNKWVTNTKALSKVSSEYYRQHQTAKQHVDKLVKKYGKENVKNIRYKEHSNERMGKYKLMNERVASGKEYVSSILINIGSNALYLNGVTPFGVISVPKGSNTRGKELYKSTKRYIK